MRLSLLISEAYALAARSVTKHTNTGPRESSSGLALGSTMPQLKLKVCGRRYDSSDEPHTGTIARQNAEAVMLDFAEPAGAGRRSLRWRWQTLMPSRGGVRSRNDMRTY